MNHPGVDIMMINHQFPALRCGFIWSVFLGELKMKFHLEDLSPLKRAFFLEQNVPLKLCRVPILKVASFTVSLTIQPVVTMV